MGGQVNVMWETWRNHRAELERTRGPFYAAVLARGIRAPARCKVATLDDVVPAPVAAAVVNGLGSTERWRYVKRFGHFEGGLTDGRRHAIFERLHPAIFDPSVEPTRLTSGVEFELSS